MREYTTKQDLIEREILPALGIYAEDFDIDKLFDKLFSVGVLSYRAGQGFSLSDDSETFWTIVEECEKP